MQEGGWDRKSYCSIQCTVCTVHYKMAAVDISFSRRALQQENCTVRDKLRREFCTFLHTFTSAVVETLSFLRLLRPDHEILIANTVQCILYQPTELEKRERCSNVLAMADFVQVYSIQACFFQPQHTAHRKKIKSLTSRGT